MEFSRLEYLFLLPLFFLFWLWARKPRQYVHQPSLRQVRKANILSRITLALPALFWLLSSWLLIFALANPVSEKQMTYLIFERKIFVLCVDASTSMGKGVDSTMEKIRALALDFVRGREGDFIGVSAYSGRPNRKHGNAATLVFPTNDLGLVEAAINSIDSQMFGSHTAIGDGIFVSLLALIEPEAKAALGARYNSRMLQASIESYGEENENLDYAKELAEKVGSQKGKFIFLFTDGKYNAGMRPAKAMWFAEQLGIKIHFAAFESSGPTGLTEEEAKKHREEIIRAVLKTGGLYRESYQIEGMKEIFAEVDSAEKNRIVVEGEPEERSERTPIVALAAASLILLILAENLWMKVP